jgi:hypothetical protein
VVPVVLVRVAGPPAEVMAPLVPALALKVAAVVLLAEAKP